MTPEPDRPARFAVGPCGEAAYRMLDSDAPCRVAAVFERSFYLESAGALACLGNPAIGLGPLNGVIEGPAGMNWQASGLRLDAPCRRGPGALHLGNLFQLSLTDTRIWRPDPAPGRPDPVRVARALDRVYGAFGQSFPAKGLAPLLARDRSDRIGTPTLAAARDPVLGARRWLGAVFDGATGEHGHGTTQWARGLLGLGPGLTPSGDDFLGGIMIALHALGRPGAARTLADLALCLVSSLGNPISAAHLSAAAEGQGHAAIHHAMNDLLRGDRGILDTRLDAVGRIGHTSGWDSLAGVVAVLEAWLAAQGVRRRAA